MPGMELRPFIRTFHIVWDNFTRWHTRSTALFWLILHLLRSDIVTGTYSQIAPLHQRSHLLFGNPVQSYEHNRTYLHKSSFGRQEISAVFFLSCLKSTKNIEVTDCEHLKKKKELTAEPICRLIRTWRYKNRCWLIGVNLAKRVKILTRESFGNALKQRFWQVQADGTAGLSSKLSQLFVFAGWSSFVS